MKKLTNDFAYGERGCKEIDWLVWAEIRYLDSPTDYREYLPKKIPTTQRGDSLVLLDGRNRSFWRWFISLVLLIGAIAIAILWMAENGL